MPADLTDAGLPVGMAILARSLDEPAAFGVVHGFEQVTGHRVRPDSAPI